ncbi:MAG: hypothetical protein PHQ34_03705 [Methanothrix sp.]|nr:hypothetical protein [Methanothrix sp.]
MLCRALIIINILFLISSALAFEIYSGSQYKFDTIYNENYLYKWHASEGIFTEDDKNPSLWAAPTVSSPTEIAISILVTHKKCGCYSEFTDIVTVLPDDTPINDTPIEAIPVNYTSKDDTPIDTTPLNDIPANDTPKDDIPIDYTSIDDTAIDDFPSDGRSLDAFGMRDNASLGEMPLESIVPPENSEAKVEAEPVAEKDPNDEIWSIPLDFGEGITVEVIAVENSPETFVASVEAVEGFSNVLEEDISQSLSNLESNSTLQSSPDTNQTTLKDLNQTGGTKATSAKIVEASSEMLQLNQSSMENTDNILASPEIEPDASEAADDQSDPEPITVSSEQLADETMLSNATSVLSSQME